MTKKELDIDFDKMEKENFLITFFLMSLFLLILSIIKNPIFLIITLPLLFYSIFLCYNSKKNDQCDEEY